MKITIDIPESVIHPLRRTAAGLQIPIERAVAIAVTDWVAALDAQFTLFGKPTLPHAEAFDSQFNEQTPEGYTIEGSYEKSRANWTVAIMKESLKL